MRIVVHDYSGHPFQVDLSRMLARRGHQVTHMYYADHPGPKGSFELRSDHPSSLRFVGVTTGFKNRSAAGTGALGFSRILREIAYGREVATIIRRIKPDIVLCGNTPADAQRAIIHACKTNGIRFVYWLQDIYSVAVMTLLAKRFGIFGQMIGRYYRNLDRRQFRDSDAVVAISEDFAPNVARLIGDVPMTVIENWGAIGDIPMGDKVNPWFDRAWSGRWVRLPVLWHAGAQT